VHAFSPDFGGVTGKPEEIQRLAKEFGVAAVKVDMGGGEYTVDHSGVVYLMDPRGEFVANYSLETSPDRMAGDIQKRLR